MIEKILIPAMNDMYGAGRGQFWDWSVKANEIRFTNGSVIILRPAEEPEHLRGLTISFFWMDEAAMGNQWPAFSLLAPGLRQANFPHYGGIATTPRAEALWIKAFWQDRVHPETGKSLKNPDQYPLFSATPMDNPHFPKEDLEELLELYPPGTRRYEQEIMGKFIALEGIAFPEFSEETHVRPFEISDGLITASPNERYEGLTRSIRATATGWDLGAVSPTSLHKVHIDEKGTFWIESEFYKSNASDYQWRGWCGENDVNRIVCDPSVSEQDRIKYRMDFALNVVRSKVKTFQDRYAIWRTALSIKPSTNEPGIFIAPVNINLREEIPNLRFARPKGREYATDAWAIGCPDHAFDDTAYAMSSLKQPVGDPVQMRSVYSGW